MYLPLVPLYGYFTFRYHTLDRRFLDRNPLLAFFWDNSLEATEYKTTIHWR